MHVTRMHLRTYNTCADARHVRHFCIYTWRDMMPGIKHLGAPIIHAPMPHLGAPIIHAPTPDMWGCLIAGIVLRHVYMQERHIRSHHIYMREFHTHICGNATVLASYRDSQIYGKRALQSCQKKPVFNICDMTCYSHL